MTSRCTGIVLDQYLNENNPLAHYYGTAVEIIEDIASASAAPSIGDTLAFKLDELAVSSSVTLGLPTRGTNGHTEHNGVTANGHSRPSSGIVDVMVVGAGTGGSVSGISRRLKEEYGTDRTTTVGVDPVGSILAQPDSLNILKDGESTVYKVEGIGYDFIPKVLDRSLVDFWVKINDDTAFKAARQLIRTEGLLVGGSSGSNMAGAVKYLTETEEGRAIAATEGKNVVVLMPDSIRNYISKPWLLNPKVADSPSQ